MASARASVLWWHCHHPAIGEGCADCRALQGHHWLSHGERLIDLMGDDATGLLRAAENAETHRGPGHLCRELSEDDPVSLDGDTSTSNRLVDHLTIRAVANHDQVDAVRLE